MPDDQPIMRHVRFTARSGEGDELARRLALGAEGLEGCDLYVVGRAPGEPDVVFVTEAWTSREAADAALEGEEAQAAVAEVLALLDGDPEMTETVPEGGTGLPRLGPQEAKGHALCNLSEVEDLAPRFGLEEIGEARFARTALEAKRTGISHHRLHPGRRGGFAHVHRAAEEVYVVLSGGGRVKLDDEIVELRDHDALRVAPETVRQFEAGPDGLEFLAVGPHVPGDGELLHGWWAD